MIYPETLRDILGTIEQLKADKRKTKTLKESIERDLRDGGQAAEDAMIRLGDAELKHSEGGAKADSKLLEDAARLRTANLARFANLRAVDERIDIIDQELTQVKIDLQLAINDWTRAEIDKARARVQSLAEQFVKDIAEPLAIGLALNDVTLCAFSRNARLTALVGMSRADLTYPVSYTAWRKNLTMVETVDKYAAILQVAHATIKETAK